MGHGSSANLGCHTHHLRAVNFADMDYFEAIKHAEMDGHPRNVRQPLHDRPNFPYEVATLESHLGQRQKPKVESVFRGSRQLLRPATSDESVQEAVGRRVG
jgi:hypothetical protein